METKVVLIDKMIFGGKCLAKVDKDDKQILVSNVLPNEKVEIKITKQMKDYDEAEIVKILEPSEFRINPKCKFFGQCGGCSMQIATDEYQRELRTTILQDVLFRAGCKNLPEIKVIYDDSWSYRNRFQFHKGGLMENSTNNSIKITECPIASKEVNYFLADEKMHNDKVFNQSERYYVFGVNEQLKSAILAPKNDNIIIGKTNKKKIKSGGKRKIYEGTTINNESLFTLEIKGKQLVFDVKGFFQSNIKMLEKTIDCLRDDFQGENLLDMYSGVGTFSLFLAENFNKTTLVEHNRDAITLAEINLQGINHESFGISGEKWSAIPKKVNFDAVVIDPPRSGIEKAVLNYLCESGIPKIKSVSCDPVTHARDLAILQKHGYEIKEMYLLDYYPQTTHIESLAVLEKV